MLSDAVPSSSIESVPFSAMKFMCTLIIGPVNYIFKIIAQEADVVVIYADHKKEPSTLPCDIPEFSEVN